MINFHVTFSRQFGGCYRFVRFHFRLGPRNWKWGDHSLKVGPYVMFRMFCLGPFGIQWG